MRFALGILIDLALVIPLPIAMTVKEIARGSEIAHILGQLAMCGVGNDA